MNDGLEFRFVTRTLSEDYRVFGDGGRALLSDRSEFEPLREKGGIDPEEGPCAALFEEGGRAFLVASGMRRGTRDVAGRPIRFSFCQIFGGGSGGRERAWAAFDRLVTSWEAAEREMRSLIREVPRADGWGEDIRLDQDTFMAWLRRGGKAAPLRTCHEGESLPAGEATWPEAGCRLKWTAGSGGLTCQRIGDGAPSPAASYRPHPSMRPERGKRRGPLLIGIAALTAFCVLGGAWQWHRVQAEREARLAAERAEEERAIARAASDIRALFEGLSSEIRAAEREAEVVRAEVRLEALRAAEGLLPVPADAARRVRAWAGEAGERALLPDELTALASADEEVIAALGVREGILTGLLQAARRDQQEADGAARGARERLSRAEARAAALESGLSRLEEARRTVERIEGDAGRAGRAATRAEAEGIAAEARDEARDAEGLIREAQRLFGK